MSQFLFAVEIALKSESFRYRSLQWLHRCLSCIRVQDFHYFSLLSNFQLDDINCSSQPAGVGGKLRKFQDIIQNEVSLGGSPTINVTLLFSSFQYFSVFFRYWGLQWLHRCHPCISRLRVLLQKVSNKFQLKLQDARMALLQARKMIIRSKSKFRILTYLMFTDIR